MRGSIVGWMLCVGVGCNVGTGGPEPGNFGGSSDSGPPDPSATSVVPDGTSSESSGESSGLGATTSPLDDSGTAGGDASTGPSSTAGTSTDGGSTDGGSTGIAGTTGGGPAPLDIDVTCNGGGAPSTYQAMMWEAPELHVLGVYEGSGNHAITAPASVTVDRGTNVTLVLSSYEAVEWTVTAAPGTTIDLVILNGYESHLANVPPGTVIDDRSGVGSYIVAAAFAYGDAETTQLIDQVELETGLSLTSFAGCYQANTFSVGQL